MNPVTVVDAIWLHRIKTPAALRKEYDFSAEDAKKIIQEALRLDVWTNPYGAGPKTNKLAKLTGFVKKLAPVAAAHSGVHVTVTDRDIVALRNEARAAGDSAQARLCADALRGDLIARRSCERVIRAQH